MTSYTEQLSGHTSLEIVAIPAGEFWMGSPGDEEGRFDDEGPQHRVTVPAFAMGRYPVTQAQYQAVMGKNPSNFTENGANCPVEQVSWHDAVAFCQKLSQQTGREYRLPSESEWEYACRAGTATPFHFGETITPDLANYEKYETTPVGRSPANAFGLHDMHGNVWEWCEDHYHDSYEGAPSDGSAWTGGNGTRLLRGGSWLSDPRNCRSAYRYHDYPGYRSDAIGFRVAVAGGGGK
jgi:formylglycine-generating enzyme required for sulfatase activity